MESCPFFVLSLSKTCYEVDVNKAFRSFSLRWHPNKNLNKNVAQKHYDDVCAAFDILKDERRRSTFERYGYQGLEWEHYVVPPSAVVFNDFWELYGGKDIVDNYLLDSKKFDEVEDTEPASFSNTIESLEKVNKFNAMFRGDQSLPVMPFTRLKPSYSSSSASPSVSDLGEVHTHNLNHSTPSLPRLNSAKDILMAEWRANRKTEDIPTTTQNSKCEKAQRKSTDNVFFSKSSEFSTIPSGTRVLVATNLDSSSSMYSGQRGIVQSFNSIEDKYVLTALDDKTSFKVKGCHLTQQIRVRVHSLQSTPQLNGTEGAITKFDVSKERYDVELDVGRLVSLKPSNVLFFIGAVVRFCGLTTAQHNGRWGTIVEIDENAERYAVKVDSSTLLRVRFENVRS